MGAFLLHLMRHGAPETPGLLLGRTDAAPLASGVAACRARAEGLAVEALFSSDLVRARLAAEAIGAAQDLPMTIDPRWRELDFGAWDGLHPSAVAPDAMAAFWNDPDANPPPQGERWSALVARVAAAIDALEPRDTLVVTHAGAMRAALAVLCSFGHPQTWAIDLPYGALLSLKVWPGERPAGQIVGLRT
jgi:alpha-ribazole phosphatase